MQRWHRWHLLPNASGKSPSTSALLGQAAPASALRFERRCGTRNQAGRKEGPLGRRVAVVEAHRFARPIVEGECLHNCPASSAPQRVRSASTLVSGIGSGADRTVIKARRKTLDQVAVPFIKIGHCCSLPRLPTGVSGAIWRVAHLNARDGATNCQSTNARKSNGRHRHVRERRCTAIIVTGSL